MADQTKTLHALAAGPLSIDDLAALVCRCPPTRRCRKQVIECVGRLMQNGLARRADVATVSEAFAANRERRVPVYRLTAEGRAWFVSGRAITSGPKGPHNGIAKGSEDTLRARAWRALRMMPDKRATLPDLVEAARRDGDPAPEKAIENLRKYLGLLARAGIVIKLAARAEGFAPTSNGFTRFAILDDLGPKAPIPTKGELLNPNDGTRRPLGAAQKQPSKRKARA